MPLVFLVVGLLLLVSAMRGTTVALGAQLKLDLFGDEKQSGFIVWIVIIAILAVIGSAAANYKNKGVQNLTQLFMIVILAALILRNPNVVQQFTQQISAAPQAAPVDTNAQEKPMTLKEANNASPGGDMLANVAKYGKYIALAF
jgi:hypothetical protein